MGMLTIILEGSFGSPRRKQFTAMKVGHAGAIAEAIKWLAEEELPKAIKNDHQCQKDGIEPADGFGGLGKFPESTSAA
jgi:hypothetical protein